MVDTLILCEKRTAQPTGKAVANAAIQTTFHNAVAVE